MEIREARVDFSHVKSVTRSFMDEFYHLLVRKDNAQGIHGDPCNWKKFKREKYEVYEDEEDK